MRPPSSSREEKQFVHKQIELFCCVSLSRVPHDTIRIDAAPERWQKAPARSRLLCGPSLRLPSWGGSFPSSALQVRGWAGNSSNSAGVGPLRPVRAHSRPTPLSACYRPATPVLLRAHHRPAAGRHPRYVHMRVLPCSPLPSGLPPRTLQNHTCPAAVCRPMQAPTSAMPAAASTRTTGS